MSNNHDLSVEVSNGYLLIAIKIPTDTCAVCGRVYTPEVEPGMVRQLYDQHCPIDQAFAASWCRGWMFVADGRPYPDNHRALVCQTCGEAITKAKREGEAAEAAAQAAVASKVTVWLR